MKMHKTKIPYGSTQKPNNRAPYAKKVIAISSGKGGVGKSTVAANLAVGLAQMGLRVGLLDADIYGPSIPRLLGVETEKLRWNDDNKMIPIVFKGSDLLRNLFKCENSNQCFIVLILF